MYNQMSQPPVRSVARRIQGHCFASPLRALVRTVNAIYDDSLRPLELTIAQLNLLVAIVNLDEDATAKRIGDVLAIEKSTLSRDLDRLEARGLVRRRVAGRAKSLELTARGQNKLEAALPAWERAQARAAEAVPALAAIAGAARAADGR